MAGNIFIRFFNFLANMGLVIRDDPPKVIDMNGREWGEARDGLVLSVRELKREDPRQVAGISVVMKNGGTDARSLTIPPWTFFYEVEGLQLSPYGRQFMKSPAKDKRTEVTLKPGEAIETDLPIATIYAMEAPGDYKLQVSCRLPGQTVLRSNVIFVRV